MRRFLAGLSDLTNLIAASVLVLSETCGLPPFPFFSDGFYRKISSFPQETRVSTVWSLFGTNIQIIQILIKTIFQNEKEFQNWYGFLIGTNL
jgi:hypothetical protein